MGNPYVGMGEDRLSKYEHYAYEELYEAAGKVLEDIDDVDFTDLAAAHLNIKHILEVWNTL